MVLQYTPYTIPLLLATVIGAVGAIVAWQRRRGPLETWGTLAQLAATLWPLTMLLVVSSESKVLKEAAMLAYVPSGMLAGTTFFVFTVHFVGRSAWLTRSRLVAIFSLPTLTLATVATNGIHKQVIKDATLTTGNSVSQIEFTLGPVFYLAFACTYVFNVSFLALLLHHALRSRNVYRKMSLILFISLLVLSIGPLISLADRSPLPHFLLFPYSYAVLGIVLVLGTSSSRFLRWLPIDRIWTKLMPQSQQTMATARDVVVQEIDNGIIILDTNSVVVDINSTARKMIGAERPIGKHIAEVAPYERITSNSVVKDVLENRGELRETTDEMWVETPTGNRCYEVRVTALTDTSGAEAGYVVLMHDITGRKRREEKLQEREAKLREQKANLETQKAQLEHQNERLDQFASIVSHDLRNPLNVAKGRLDILLTMVEQSDAEIEPEHGTEVKQSLERMEAIIDDALTLARQGKAITETEPVSLLETIEQAWSNVDTKAATLAECDDVMLESDQNRLLNVFENLFRNAIDHGRSDITIRVGILDDGFYVEDDGPGIPDAKKEQIFEQGYTTSSHGTGFGLSIVSDIVRAHGWEITATDGIDGGARFEITGVEWVQREQNSAENDQRQDNPTENDQRQEDAVDTKQKRENGSGDTEADITKDQRDKSPK